MTVSHQPVPFKQAGDYVLTFGKHQGQTIDTVASTDNGLLYLDFLRGIRLDFHTKNAVCTYLDDPTIAKDLAALVEARK
jgi:hypothetical protein